MSIFAKKEGENMDSKFKLSDKIEVLDWSRNTYIILKQARINTIEDLKNLTIDRLVDNKDLERRNIKEIIKKLKELKTQ